MLFSFPLAFGDAFSGRALMQQFTIVRTIFFAFFHNFKRNFLSSLVAEAKMQYATFVFRPQFGVIHLLSTSVLSWLPFGQV